MHPYAPSFSALGSSARSSSSVARALRAEEYSLRHRIRSILEDRQFVAATRADYPTLPLFANLRCGVWYVDECSTSITSAVPTSAAGVGAGGAVVAPAAGAPCAPAAASAPLPTSAEACYFKSTDGHAHHWKFSESRLNVHVLQRILQHQQAVDAAAAQSEATGDRTDAAAPCCTGALIVDSTRKGKRFPDSFSRTIPIWCAVWNRAIAEVRRRAATQPTSAAQGEPHAANQPTPKQVAEWDTELHMPLWVSDMESRQIEERMAGFVSTLMSSGVDLVPIARDLRKPLRCLWIDRSSSGWQDGERDLACLPFTPLLLLQCSRAESETRGIGQRQGWSYIQGAGDDEEHWASVGGIVGFAPRHLTAHKDELRHMEYDEDIRERIQEIIKEEQAGQTPSTHARDQIYRMPYGESMLLAATALPAHATATTFAASHLPASVSPSPLALLYLYFDSTHAEKQQRRSKLALENQRAQARAQGEDEASEEAVAEAEAQLAAISAQDERGVDLGDWPLDASLALPISSQSKSRTSLLDVLDPSMAFIQSQIARGRTVLLVCEDVSYVSCVCAAALLSRPTISVAAPSSCSAPSSAASTVSAVGASAASALLDKGSIRSALTVVKGHLPQHFPSRLLLKQLNSFFLSVHHE